MTGRYHSPIGLHPFQAEGVERALAHANVLCTWETGLGKTHLSMALAARLWELGRVGLVVILAEKNKIEDWIEEFETYTDFSVKLYHGAKREAIASDLPEVLVSTYETFVKDAYDSKERKLLTLGRNIGPRSPLIIFDESVVKLRNRSSGLYRGIEWMLHQFRKLGLPRTLHLTATPIESSPENVFNLLRLIEPDVAPRVADFEKWYVLFRDEYGRALKFRNVNDEDHYDRDVTTFRNLLEPYTIHKSKVDEDIRHLFPEVEETFEHLQLDPLHFEFYNAVVDTFAEEGRSLFPVLRMLTSSPETLLASQSEVALKISEVVGADGLRLIPSAKLDRAVQRLQEVTSSGRQAVAFTFFGQTVLPLLQARLEAAGVSVVVNHGQMTAKARKAAERAFRAGDKQVFLSSDAGARGLNLPEATYLLNVELPVTHANYVQRINRISRINSKADNVTVESLIAQDTIEEAIVELLYKRNHWHDQLLEDTEDGNNWVTAEERRALIYWSKARDLRIH